MTVIKNFCLQFFSFPRCIFGLKMVRLVLLFFRGIRHVREIIFKSILDSRDERAFGGACSGTWGGVVTRKKRAFLGNVHMETKSHQQICKWGALGRFRYSLCFRPTLEKKRHFVHCSWDANTLSQMWLLVSEQKSSCARCQCVKVPPWAKWPPVSSIPENKVHGNSLVRCPTKNTVCWELSDPALSLCIEDRRQKFRIRFHPLAQVSAAFAPPCHCSSSLLPCGGFLKHGLANDITTVNKTPFASTVLLRENLFRVLNLCKFWLSSTRIYTSL